MEDTGSGDGADRGTDDERGPCSPPWFVAAKSCNEFEGDVAVRHIMGTALRESNESDFMSRGLTGAGNFF